MKILVDANVALDVLLQREPFYVSGVQIFGLSDGGVELFVSSSTITDIFYITKRELKSKQAAMTMIKNLLASVDVAAVTGGEIRRAIDLNWGDFEDAVQYAAGESISVDYIVTRNTSDFASALLPVATPDQLLSIVTTASEE